MSYLLLIGAASGSNSGVFTWNSGALIGMQSMSFAPVPQSQNSNFLAFI